ncbi:MAG TPA: hypothetical protein VK177_11975 [Flavobacteriales bacterium]|nr:hypothetical protein [Flavobacteriales bacterium]
MAKNLIVISGTNQGKTEKNTQQIPFEPVENENDDENEKEDDTDDTDEENPFCKSVLTYTYDGLSFVQKSTSFVASFQNRSTVSLFILYHSWKSFLS